MSVFNECLFIERMQSVYFSFPFSVVNYILFCILLNGATKLIYLFFSTFFEVYLQKIKKNKQKKRHHLHCL